MTISDRFHALLKNTAAPNFSLFFFFFLISHSLSITVSLAHTLPHLSSDNYCKIYLSAIYIVSFCFCYFASSDHFSGFVLRFCLVLFPPRCLISFLPSLSLSHIASLCVRRYSLSLSVVCCSALFPAHVVSNRPTWVR